MELTGLAAVRAVVRRDGIERDLDRLGAAPERLLETDAHAGTAEDDAARDEHLGERDGSP